MQREDESSNSAAIVSYLAYISSIVADSDHSHPNGIHLITLKKELSEKLSLSLGTPRRLLNKEELGRLLNELVELRVLNATGYNRQYYSQSKDIRRRILGNEEAIEVRLEAKSEELRGHLANLEKETSERAKRMRDLTSLREQLLGSIRQCSREISFLEGDLRPLCQQLSNLPSQIWNATEEKRKIEFRDGPISLKRTRVEGIQRDIENIRQKISTTRGEIWELECVNWEELRMKYESLLQAKKVQLDRGWEEHLRQLERVSDCKLVEAIVEEERADQIRQCDEKLHVLDEEIEKLIEKRTLLKKIHNMATE